MAKKPGAKGKPRLTIRRFNTEQEAEDYAESTSERLRKRSYRIARTRRKSGVTVLTGVKRPAVLVLTPRGKIPKLPKVRITPKRPRIS